MSILVYRYEVWGEWILIWKLMLVGAWFAVRTEQEVPVSCGNSLGLGWNLSSWVKSLISTTLVLLIILSTIILIYYCLRKQTAGLHLMG